jgi:hypothetical protein
MSRLINLLPDPVLDTNRQISSVYQGTVLTLIGVILFILLNLTILFLSLRAENTLKETKNQVAAVEQEIANLRPVEEKLLVLQDKLLRYQRFDSEHKQLHNMWDVLINARQNTVALSSVDFTNETDLVVAAKTDNLINAVNFLITIRQDELLSDFVVQEITYESNEQTYEFVTKFVITPDVE